MLGFNAALGDFSAVEFSGDQDRIENAEEDVDTASAIETEALNALIETAPTTLAGASGVLNYVVAHHDGALFAGQRHELLRNQDMLVDFLTTIGEAIEDVLDDAAITRRDEILAHVLGGSLAKKPTITHKELATTDDPIFAAIEAHRRALDESMQAYIEVDEAEGEARKEHGQRPSELIVWRNHHIGSFGVDDCRERFLREREMPWSDQALPSPEEIEREYQDAKARYEAVKQAAREWDERAGIAHLRQRNHDLREAFFEAGRRLAETRPTTSHGAGALVAYVCEQLEESEQDWHVSALKTIAEVLVSAAAVLEERS